MNKKLSLLAAPLLLMAANANAQGLIEFGATYCPYVGIDAQLRHMSFRKDFGHNLFKKNYGQVNLVGGLKFSDYVGVEVGYEQGFRRSGNSANTSESIELGRPIATVLGASITQFSTNSFRIHGPHASIIGFLPFCVCDQNFEWIGSVGIARLSAKFTHEPTGFRVFGRFLNLPEDIRSEFTAGFKKRKTVLRAMAGLQQNITQNVIIRASVAWEKTSKFRNIAPRDQILNAQLRGSLKDSVLYGLGIYWKF